MTYKHGVEISEVPTSVLPPVNVSSGIPFVIGTAPVNMTDVANVNIPKLCYSYTEAVGSFGYVPPKADASGVKKYEYGLSEFAYSQFALYGVAPVIFVNVLDPAKHKKQADTVKVTLSAKDGTATVAETGIIASSVSISEDGSGAYTAGNDYVTAFDGDGNLVISSMKDDNGDYLCTTGTELTFSADKLDPSAVTEEDIIGGVDAAGKKTGLELIDECFARFRLVPGTICAPGYSGNSGVAAIMATKAGNINEHFSAIALIDVPDSVRSYTDVAQWKNTENIVDPRQVCLFPMLSLDGTVYHMSTQYSGLAGQVDGNHNDMPYVSPSNSAFKADKTVLADGTEVWLGIENANYLNGEGVVTALNFIGGWKCWGSRTACYPSVTDVKDSFIPIRRMFSWIANTLVQTFWQRVDAPLNRRQVDTIIDSANIWLNGLAAQGCILGGRVEFMKTENSTADLMDGKAKFHVFITPPSPNREIDFVLEYDPDYLQTLFE